MSNIPELKYAWIKEEKPKQNNKIYSPDELGSEVAEHELC